MESFEFSFITKYGKFSDVIYLPENHGLTEEEINNMKIERLNNWLTYLDDVHAQQAQGGQ